MLTTASIDVKGISRWYGVDEKFVSMCNDLIIEHSPDSIIDIIDEVTRRLKRYAHPIELITLGYLCGLHNSLKSTNEYLFDQVSHEKRLN